MGVNTTRLLLIVISINLLISIAYAIYDDPNTFELGIADQVINLGENYGSSIGSEGTTVSPENYQQEGSFGNAVRMGVKIFGLFVRGLNPFPFATTTLTNPVDQVIALALTLFRIFMYMVIGIKLYQVYKNKDTQ